MMKILERLLSVFSHRQRNLLGAVDQPVDIVTYLHRIRADTYQRITGKPLIQTELPTKQDDIKDDLRENLSPSRRLLGRRL